MSVLSLNNKVHDQDLHARTLEMRIILNINDNQ